MAQEITQVSTTMMNKPIRFMGLSALQAMILFVFVTASSLGMMMSGINFIVILVIYSVGGVGLSKLLKKLKIAAENGTPDFFSATNVFRYTPRKITNTKCIFNLIIKENKNGN